MPYKKTLIVLIAAFLLISFKSLHAQVTENHIGVRGGIHSGLYFQNLVTAGNAERSFYAMLSADNSSLRLTVMRLTYEMTMSEISDNLYLVWGYGGHAGFSVNDHTYFLGRKYQFEYERFRPVAGVDVYGGLEYRFMGMPMTIGLSLKPYVEIMVPGFVSIKPGDLGLSFGYRF
jgi:hypothetical protein